METAKIIHERKSPLSFTNEKVDADVLKTIVEAGNFAPVYGAVHFTVIENAALLSAIKNATLAIFKEMGGDFAKAASAPGYDPLYGAPVAIVLSALGGNDEQGFNMANVSCAAENMILSATDLGIGARYVMAPVLPLTAPEMKQQLQLPDDQVPLCMVLLGHTTETILTPRTHDHQNINYIQ